MTPEKLTKRDVELLLKLVDAEVHRICSEASTPLPTPESSTLTVRDSKMLEELHISWEGDTRC